MKKKRIGILLIMSLLMIMSITVISAADTNDTLLEEVSDMNIALADDVGDTNIASTSSALEQDDNDTSLQSESADDIKEINVDEISNQKVGSAVSNSKEVLSASNDDLLGINFNFLYDGLYNGVWYQDLDVAIRDACNNGGGTIYITSKEGGWGYDSHERDITISAAVDITFMPYDDGEVIFDGQRHDYWFFEIKNNGAHITFNNITFINGGALEGGAIDVTLGQATFNNCTFIGNNAYQNVAGGYGWGGAIFVANTASIVANNCEFRGNDAASGGGAVLLESSATGTFNNCYFVNNTADGSPNHVQDKDSGSHSFTNCLFVGSGSLDIEVDAPTKSVSITPDVDDDVNLVVLYKDGVYYDSEPGTTGYTTTFSDLERGTYTVYMMKGTEQRYEYSDSSFTIIEPYFVLNDKDAFVVLREAIEAIPENGEGVITVEGGVYDGNVNTDILIENKNVTSVPNNSNFDKKIILI